MAEDQQREIMTGGQPDRGVEDTDMIREDEVPEEVQEPYVFTEEDKQPILLRIHWMSKLIAGLDIAMFGWFIFLGFYDIDNPTFTSPVMILYMGFVILGVYLWIDSNSFVRIDEQKIQYCVLKGSYQMFWREVKGIATDGYNLFFYGYDKHIWIPGNWWVTPKGKKKIIFVYYMADQKRIDFYHVTSEEIPHSQHNAKF